MSKKLTKVKALIKLLEDFGGMATWDQIYSNIEKYYPEAKKGEKWKEGLRGVLYREIKKGKYFKRIGLGIFALKDFKEEPPPKEKEVEKMHSFIQGICIEIGKNKGFLTYSPDRSKIFKRPIKIGDITDLKEVPEFTYKSVINIVRYIDVIWFTKDEIRKFPVKAFEVVHSLGTLNEAINRMMELIYFRTDFVLIAPQKYREKIKRKLNLRIYQDFRERLNLLDYNEILNYYEALLREVEIRQKLGGIL